MERFLFSLSDGVPHPDEESVDLPDVAAARGEAARVLSDALKLRSEEFWRDGRWVLTVSDERGLVLFSIYVDAIASAATGPPGR